MKIQVTHSVTRTRVFELEADDHEQALHKVKHADLKPSNADIREKHEVYTVRGFDDEEKANANTKLECGVKNPAKAYEEGVAKGSQYPIGYQKLSATADHTDGMALGSGAICGVAIGDPPDYTPLVRGGGAVAGTTILGGSKSLLESWGGQLRGVVNDKSWQQRLINESEELEARIIALEKFMVDRDSQTIDGENWKLLVRQLNYMKQYAEVLKTRISLLPKTSNSSQE